MSPFLLGFLIVFGVLVAYGLMLGLFYGRDRG